MSRLKINHKGRGVYSPQLIEQSPPNRFIFMHQPFDVSISYINLFTTSEFTQIPPSGSFQFRFFSNDLYETKSVRVNYELAVRYRYQNDFHDIFSIPYDPYVNPLDDPLIIENDDPTALRLFLDSVYENFDRLTLLVSQDKTLLHATDASEFTYRLYYNRDILKTPTTQLLKTKKIPAFAQILLLQTWVALKDIFKALKIVSLKERWKSIIKSFYVRINQGVGIVFYNILSSNLLLKVFLQLRAVFYQNAAIQRILMLLRKNGAVLYRIVSANLTLFTQVANRVLRTITLPVRRAIGFPAKSFYRIDATTSIDRVLGRFRRGSASYVSYAQALQSWRLIKIRELLRATRNFYDVFHNHILLNSEILTKALKQTNYQIWQKYIYALRTKNVLQKNIYNATRKFQHIIRNRALHQKTSVLENVYALSRRMNRVAKAPKTHRREKLSNIIATIKISDAPLYIETQELHFKKLHEKPLNLSSLFYGCIFNYRQPYSYLLDKNRIYQTINLEYYPGPFYRVETIMYALKEAVRNIFYNTTLGVVPVRAYFPEKNITHSSFASYVVTGSGGDLTQTVSVVDEQFNGNVYSITFSGFFMNNIPPDASQYILMFDYTTKDVLLHMEIGKDYIDSINDYSSISVPNLYLSFYFG